jgi:putative Mn2+ efflux pump MntP
MAFQPPDRPMLSYLNLALELTASPVALAGYIGLGVYATSTWRAIKYALLWGLAVQIFALALGKVSFLDMQGLVAQTALRLIGALIVTMGVYYLYRFMRGRSGGKGPQDGGPPSQERKPPHLRRVR